MQLSGEADAHLPLSRVKRRVEKVLKSAIDLLCLKDKYLRYSHMSSRFLFCGYNLLYKKSIVGLLLQLRTCESLYKD